ncbi:tyrosine-type recombinase/integrase [Sinorhizobium meliloti]|uniref:tyrosine-type recombinase/integrase n=1 Tax=Rhizobium meliloti TaxID=382 RepID=UPI0003178152|nr:site-specific integrase [Sinorhizobium meliloti]MDE3766140.1 integrase arm-type DNA-binding domain-containing protein [Sinorhizobium meliloti]MDE3781234.1 integrase arm-type DNA-binding domain-containing protein [Sinorhizobium meliloti]MDE3804003.1 integrase arm-type DNA-binding domain-containing protein [Sinorhizobium meliloti]
MTKAKSAFTAKWVDAVQATDKRQEIPDPSLKGFYLIVQPLPGGAKSWAVRYKGHPKFTIGSFGAWKLADARKEAGRVMRAYDEGRDPRAEKQEANSGENLVENVLDDFLKRHVKAKNKARTAYDVENTIKREIKPKWKGKRITAIRRRDVVNLLDDMVDRGVPTMAVRTYALLKKLFNWCVERGILEISPMGGLKAPATVAARDRVLSDTELRWAWQAADDIGWPFGPLFKMLMVTAQRKEEVAGAARPEFVLNVKEPTWLIPPARAKNGREHLVLVMPLVVGLIEALPVIDESDLLFTTNGKTTVGGFSKAKERLDAAMLRIGRKEAEERGDDPDEVTIEPWVLHDFRRTAASGMAALGVQPHVIEAVLNHKSGTIKGVAAVYNRHDYYEEKRAALVLWERRVKAIIAAKPRSNAVAFEGSGRKKGVENKA